MTTSEAKKDKTGGLKGKNYDQRGMEAMNKQLKGEKIKIMQSEGDQPGGWKKHLAYNRITIKLEGEEGKPFLGRKNSEVLKESLSIEQNDWVWV